MCDKWMPIDTAPTDGTDMLLYDGRDVTTGCYVTGYEHEPADQSYAGWYSANGSEVFTHWMPLPQPPKEATE